MLLDQDVKELDVSGRAVFGSRSVERQAISTGAGINYLISENKILSADYSQADFGTERKAHPGFASGLIESDLEIEMIKITYSYKF